MPTPRQREVLVAIRRLTEPRGPTMRELADHLGMRSTCTIFRHVAELRVKGLISVPPGTKARGLMLTEAGLEESRKGGG